MEFITGSLALLGLIVTLATQAGIPPEMVLAIIEAESGGNPYATVFNPNAGVKMQFKRPALCSEGTEKIHQGTAWGLMQVMGLTARGLGFEGWLSELVDPEVNVRLGVAYLAELKGRFGASYGLDGVIAAYRKGAPRKTTEGKFSCQGYVDNVKKLMRKHADVVVSYKAAAPENVLAETPDNTAVAAEIPAQESPDDALAMVPAREELDRYIDSRSHEELIAIAKELGVKISANAKDKTIVEKLKAELGAREDLNSIVAEMKEVLENSKT